MGEVSTIGLDIAKSVFQIHGVDVDGPLCPFDPVCHSLLVEKDSLKYENKFPDPALGNFLASA
jgi:hypothetical protein